MTTQTWLYTDPSPFRIESILVDPDAAMHSHRAINHPAFLDEAEDALDTAYAVDMLSDVADLAHRQPTVEDMGLWCVSVKVRHTFRKEPGFKLLMTPS